MHIKSAFREILIRRKYPPPEVRSEGLFLFSRDRIVNHTALNRRQFVTSMGGLSAGLAAARLVHAELVEETNQAGWQTFTPEQAALLEAVTACVIPTDDAPGAREAGVVRFIDRWLNRYEPDSKPAYTTGLQDLERRTRAKHPRAASFAALTPPQQIALLTTIEKSDFFGLVRSHSVMGYLGAPSYGGNRGEVGWKAIGFENHGIWQAPFGWYDTPGNDAR
jgi:gluconate 2-dehydrogenase gamma chain